MNLDSIPPIPNDVPDKDAIEKAKEESRKLDNERFGLKNNRYGANTTLRNSLCTWSAVLVSFWLLAVLLILVGNTTKYKLSDSVIITLLTTTTIKVLGLIAIVMYDLFHGQSENNI